MASFADSTAEAVEDPEQPSLSPSLRAALSQAGVAPSDLLGLPVDEMIDRLSALGLDLDLLSLADTAYLFQSRGFDAALDVIAPEARR